MFQTCWNHQPYGSENGSHQNFHVRAIFHLQKPDLGKMKKSTTTSTPGDGEIIFICAFQVLGKWMPTPPRSVLWNSDIVKVVPWIRVKVTPRYHTSFLFTDWSFKVNTHQRIARVVGIVTSMSLFASLAINLGDAPTTDMIYDHIWYVCTKDPMFLLRKHIGVTSIHFLGNKGSLIWNDPNLWQHSQVAAETSGQSEMQASGFEIWNEGDNGINYQLQLVGWISEPSTVLMMWSCFNSRKVMESMHHGELFLNEILYPNKKNSQVTVKTCILKWEKENHQSSKIPLGGDMWSFQGGWIE